MPASRHRYVMLQHRTLKPKEFFEKFSVVTLVLWCRDTEVTKNKNKLEAFSSAQHIIFSFMAYS